MQTRVLAESYINLLKSLKPYLSDSTKNLIKQIKPEEHMELVKLFESKIDKEELKVITESYKPEVVSSFVDIAREILILNKSQLVESIKAKVGEDTNQVDFLIDCALAYESMKLAFDEDMAKEFVKKLVEQKKKEKLFQEQLRIIKQSGVV